MVRSLALFVSTAMLLTACTSPKPVAAPKVTPPAPAIGVQADCSELIAMEDSRCLGWTAPEPHGFFDVRRINDDEAGVGKELQWGPYYWCAALNDNVVEDALGSTDVARVVTDKFYCQIAVRGHKSSGIYNGLSVYLSPYQPGNPAFDWFVEPNELGEVTEYKGRKVTRNDKLSYSLGDRIQYTVEIPGHGSVWNVELQRSLSNPRLEFNPDPADAERRTRMVVDALMAYDQT